MRKIICFLALAAIGLSADAAAVISEQNISRKGKNVTVSFTLEAGHKSVPSKYKEVIMPYLYNGTDTLWLKTLTVYGKNKYRRTLQEKTLSGERMWTAGPEEIVGEGKIMYTDTVQYSRWMKNVSLGIRRKLAGCNTCTEKDSPSEANIASAGLYIAPVPVFSNAVEQERNYTISQAKTKWDFGKKEMIIYFPVGKSILIQDSYGNRETIETIIKVLETIKNDRKLSINTIEITGSASPEGSLNLNSRLAAARANALKAILIENSDYLEDSNFEINNGKENWTELYNIIEKSGFAWKDEVLAVIRGKSGEERKAALKKVHGGKAYRYMLDNIYPELRNACYISVYYDKYSDRTADELNKANALISEGKYDSALEILMAFSDDDRSFNSIGVCLMMLERDEEAVKWFEKALSAGYSEAEENLKQIM